MFLQVPTLQGDLFNILLRFRKNPVALVYGIADKIAPEYWSLHRFLWRDLDLQKAPEEYKFSRVVFGVNSSPFVAQSVSQHHAQIHRTEYSLAAETVLKMTCVDDGMESVSNDKEGSEIYKRLSQLWHGPGMHDKKWLWNSSVVLNEIPPEDGASQTDLKKGFITSTKTFGVLWQATEDAFTFKDRPPNDFSFAKRKFLSNVVTLFHPLGFLTPFAARVEDIPQDLWITGLNWDGLKKNCRIFPATSNQSSTMLAATHKEKKTSTLLLKRFYEGICYMD